MADPQHTPKLDAHDALTVRLYRVGLTLGASTTLLLSGWMLGVNQFFAIQSDLAVRALELILGLGSAFALVNLHLYDKRVRWIIVGSGVAGLWLMASSSLFSMPWIEHLIFHAGLGFVFVVYSALALKEQFCFRIPGLKLVPLFLATSLIPAVLQQPVIFGALLLPAGLCMGLLSLAKWRMPLGHDIGDKSNYQV